MAVFRLAAFVALMLGALAVQAQSFVDEQLNKAMAGLESAFTRCGNGKFFECISNLQKDGFGVSGVLNRVVDGRGENTEIDVAGNLSVSFAQFSFDSRAKSLSTPPGNPGNSDFWRTETFAASAGQPGSGVLNAWLSGRALDDPVGHAFGVLICGNLVAEFDLLLPASFNNPVAGQGLADAAHGQLKAIMLMVGNALESSGACGSGGGLKVQVLAIEPSVVSNVRLPSFPIKAIIRGLNFARSEGGVAPRVSVGGELTSVESRFLSSTELEVTLPGFVDRPEGPRDVTVTNPDDRSGTGAGLFFVSGLELGLEINQGVRMECMDAHPCIADHNTVVRVKVACNDRANANCAEGKERVQGWLHVYDQNQRPIDGSPFAADPPRQGNASAPVVRVLPSGATAAVADRQSGADQLNFYFTNERALPAGRYTFSFEINPRNPNELPTRESTPDEKKNVVQTLFGRPFVTSGGFLRIGAVMDLNDLDAGRFNTAQVVGLFKYLRAAYPVSQSRVEVVPLPAIPYRVDRMIETLVTVLNQENARNPATPPLNHIVWFSSNQNLPQGFSLGCSPLQITLGSFPCTPAAVVFFDGRSDVGSVITHEIGHLYGLGDTYVDIAGGGHRWSTLNPVNDDCIVLGVAHGCPLAEGMVDTLSRTVSVDPKVWQSHGEYEANAKVDFMGNAGRDVSWVEPRVWNHLYTQFKHRLPAPGVVQLHGDRELRPGARPESILVSGSIGTDGSVRLHPFLAVGAAAPSASLPSGRYAFELHDAQGVVLRAIRFDVSSELLDAGAGFRERSPFSFTTAVVPGTTRFVLKQGGLELAARSVSAHAPVVAVLAPNGGEVLEANVRVRWTGSDDDGDSLSYSVFYSAGGAAWLPVALDVGATVVDLDTRQWPGSGNGKILVVATDGVHEGSDTSDAPFAVSRKGPVVAIRSPPNGLMISTGQSLLLAAAGYDWEDGELKGQALSFASDVDGPLGQGAELFASGLSRGMHTITLTGTDADGNRAATSASVTVSAEPAVAKLELGSASLVFDAVAVGDRSTRFLFIRNLGNARLTLGSFVVGDPQFTLGSTAPLDIAPGQDATISVQFAPTGQGPAATTLLLTSNDASMPEASVALAGTGVSRPRLSAVWSQNQLVLTWPTAASDFRLETTTSLRPPATWNSLPGSWPIVGDVFRAGINPDGGQRFYRLTRP